MNHAGDLADAAARYRSAQSRYEETSARSAQLRLTGRRREWLAANDASLAAAAGLDVARGDLVTAALSHAETPCVPVGRVSPIRRGDLPSEPPLDASPLSFFSLAGNDTRGTTAVSPCRVNSPGRGRRRGLLGIILSIRRRREPHLPSQVIVVLDGSLQDRHDRVAAHLVVVEFDNNLPLDARWHPILGRLHPSDRLRHRNPVSNHVGAGRTWSQRVRPSGERGDHRDDGHTNRYPLAPLLLLQRRPRPPRHPESVGAAFCRLLGAS